MEGTIEQETQGVRMSIINEEDERTGGRVISGQGTQGFQTGYINEQGQYTGPTTTPDGQEIFVYRGQEMTMEEMGQKQLPPEPTAKQVCTQEHLTVQKNVLKDPQRYSTEVGRR